MPVAAAHDLHLPRAGAGDGGSHLWPLITSIADDALDERKETPRLPQQRLGTIAKGRTIVLVTHRHSMLALVDRLIVLDRGKVVADGPKAGVLEALMGGRVQARE